MSEAPTEAPAPRLSPSRRRRATLPNWARAARRHWRQSARLARPQRRHTPNSRPSSTRSSRANETELDKARREATEAREQANQSAIESLRFRIAAEKGITDNVDLILTAGDEDTMRRQADLWVSRTPETTAGPRPDLTQGGSGQPPALNSDGLEDALRSKLGI